METRCCQKKFEFRRYPPKDFCTARYEHKSSKNKFQTFRKPRKKYFLGRSWGKIGLRKLSQMLVRSGEIPSPRQTSIDKNDDCAMKSERGVLVRGSDQPSGHSVHKTTGDRWRAPARRLVQTHSWTCYTCRTPLVRSRYPICGPPYELTCNPPFRSS